MITGSLALVVLLCLATTARNALYHDAVLLWSDAVQKSPDKARPHNNLGHAYAQQGKWDLAIEEFRIALTLQPDYPLAQRESSQRLPTARGPGLEPAPSRVPDSPALRTNACAYRRSWAACSHRSRTFNPTNSKWVPSFDILAIKQRPALLV